MNYRLRIIKTEDNANYLEDKKVYEEKCARKYGYNETIEVPQREFDRNILDVVLTEEQWEKVKQEVIKIFK